MGGYHIDIGQKTIQKAKAQPAEGVRQWGMLTFFLVKGATYLTNNKKGSEIGDIWLASKKARPRGIKRSLPVLTWISGDGKRPMRTPVLNLLGWWLGPFCSAPWGRPVNKVNPMGTKNGRVPPWQWAKDNPKSEGSTYWRRSAVRDAYLLLRERGNLSY